VAALIAVLNYRLLLVIVAVVVTMSVTYLVSRPTSHRRAAGSSPADAASPAGTAEDAVA
jgi:hypothetical protein